MKYRILWIGDAACDSGFAECTHKTGEALREAWEFHVLGINYRGDPHSFPYDIYPAHVGGDILGLGRLEELFRRIKPHIVVIQNDPWNVPTYIKVIETIKDVPRPMLVGNMAVDAKNCRGWAMNGLDHVVFWTEFAAYEAVRGGFKKPYSIIPLGVDLDLFKPGDRLEARRYLGLGPVFQESFIVGNINRNQPRKRFDLSIEAFAEWIKNYDAPDAALYLHVCPTGDMGYNLDELAGYYGLHNKFILCQPEVFRGATKRQVAATMRAFNVGFTTSVAEGWGLPVMETMASGVPNVVPHNSAYAEWAVGAAVSVPCRPVASLGIPSMGGEPSVEGMVEAFNRLYKDREFYKQVSEAGLARVREPKYRWENIGATWHEVLKTRYAEWLE